MHECIDAAFWNRSLPSAFVSGKNKDDIYYHIMRGLKQKLGGVDLKSWNWDLRTKHKCDTIYSALQATYLLLNKMKIALH